MTKKPANISIKYKFLAVLLLVLVSSLSIFFYFSYVGLREDKRLFVNDMNLSGLKAATSEIKLEIKSRLEELQVFIPRVFQASSPITQVPLLPNEVVKTPINTPPPDPFVGLPPVLQDEILAVTFFRQQENGTFTKLNGWENNNLYKKRNFPSAFLEQLNHAHPLKLAAFVGMDEPRLMNRSVSMSDGRPQGIITVIINGAALDETSTGLIIVADFDNSFVRRVLDQSQLTEIFLLSSSGNLLAHSSLDESVRYANDKYPHPVTERLMTRLFPRESLELTVKGEEYLCGLSETGYPDVFAVSQIKKREAFAALRALLQKSLILALLILFVSAFLSTLFASTLTSNIRKLKAAAQSIGEGHFNVKLRIRSRDEIQSVAESFEWMSNRIEELMVETVKKARLQEELQTARLVQSTILQTAEIKRPAVDLQSYYDPATECGGDFWDAHVVGDILTVFVGDATGHGAPAAIVTAVAKSCFTTVNEINRNKVQRPEELLDTLNKIIYRSCRGKLLMTMAIVQVDLRTGALSLCNAGHEAPLLTRIGSATEPLIARGERLGFDPASVYQPTAFQLEPKDTLLLYTDGICEARNKQGKEWGERGLKKVLKAKGADSLVVLRDEMVKKFRLHADGVAPDDDVTFVLLRWKGPDAEKTSPGPTGEPVMAPPPMPKDELKQELLKLASQKSSTAPAATNPTSTPPLLKSLSKAKPEKTDRAHFDHVEMGHDSYTAEFEIPTPPVRKKG